MIYEIIVSYKGKVAYRYVSTKISDVLRAIRNVTPGFIWKGTIRPNP